MSFHLVSNQTVSTDSAGKLEVKILGINVYILVTLHWKQGKKNTGQERTRGMSLYMYYFATIRKPNKTLYSN